MSDRFPLVTLTTDFGEQDPYVAAMKGVLYARCPLARIADLSHAIPPQDIRAGAFFLAGCVPYFPAGTIHVAVVDPGVGAMRHPVAAEAGGQYFIGPDNGLFSLALRRLPLTRAYVIENRAAMAETVSATFHGRDVFAPAAAALACGMPLEAMGRRLSALTPLDAHEPAVSNGVVRGVIIHIDRFGNCLANITAEHLGSRAARNVRAGKHTISSIRRTYGDAERGETLALIGSSGHLEVAVREGHAARSLNLGIGDPVEVTLA